MCQALPGLRCANHLGIKRDDLVTKIGEGEEEHRAIETSIQKLQERGTQLPSERAVDRAVATSEAMKARQEFDEVMNRGWDSWEDEEDRASEIALALDNVTKTTHAFNSLSRTPTPANKEAELSRLTGQLSESHAHLSALKSELSQVQKEYDMTQTGRSRLAEMISHEHNDSFKKDLEERLARAEEGHRKVSQLVIGERQGLEQSRVATNQLPILTYVNERSVSAFNASEELSKAQHSYHSQDEMRDKFMAVNHDSQYARALFGTTALQDPTYGAGTYGVFHSAEGRPYLSKVVDDTALTSISFENGRTSTSINPADTNIVLVEKNTNNKTVHSLRPPNKRNSLADAVKKMGTVSKHILNEIPDEHKADAAQALDSIRESILLTPDNHQDSKAMFNNLQNTPANDPVRKSNKQILLRAIKYALLSPRVEEDRKAGKIV